MNDMGIGREALEELVTANRILAREGVVDGFGHAGVYGARPEVRAIVHHHSPSVIPFGVTGTRLRPLMHMCASMGYDIPTWDSRTTFGDTNLLVTNLEMARDLA